MIGKRIRALRQKKGLSITELADLAGVAKSYLSCIERNIKKNPSLQFLEKVSGILDVDVETLIGKEEVDRKLEVEEAGYEECVQLAREAIQSGLTKKQFVRFLELSQWYRTMGNIKE